MKGLNEFLDAFEQQLDNKPLSRNYCLYYNSEGVIYEASPEQDDTRNYFEVPNEWMNKEHITDWIIHDNKLVSIKQDAMSRLKKLTEVTNTKEFNGISPVYVTENDFRVIKRITTFKELSINKQERYYQL